jgi:hypothetical protein
VSRAFHSEPRGTLSAAEHAELDELRRSQSGLWLARVEPRWLRFRGRLSLRSGDGIEVDSYLIECAFPRDPASEDTPSVIEVGGRIPREAERHIFTNTGACCIELPVEYLRRGKQGLSDYVNGPLRSYFIAQSHFECTGMWPHGELAHGACGIQQFCDRAFGTTNLALVRAALKAVESWRSSKHRACPCGSGRRFIRCHGRRFAAARSWPPAARRRLRRLIAEHAVSEASWSGTASVSRGR